MHVEHLMSFSAVATQRSFTRAAAILSLSQSAVSQQIKELEQYFGQRLFERTTRRLALTPAGERLLAHAAGMIAHLQAAKSELSGLSDQAAGLLQIGCTHTIGTYLLPALLTEVQRDARLVRICARVAPLPDLMGDMMARRVELILASETLPAHLRDEFSHEFAGRDEIVLIVAPGHPWADRKTIAPPDLAGERLVARLPGSPLRELVFRRLHELGATPGGVKVELGSTEAIKQAVEVGLGFGFASRSAVRHELAVGRLAEVAVQGLDLVRDRWLISLPSGQRSSRAEFFRRIVLSALDEAAREPAEAAS